MTNPPSGLAAALAAFQSEMPTVPKGKTADTGKYRYTYADLADVTQAAMPILSRHGLSFLTRPRRTEQGDYELVGTLLHTSGEREEGSLPLVGRSPQELGSALTYMRRYLFGCMTGLVTDDDDDGNLAQPAARAPRQRKAPTPTGNAPEAASEQQVKKLNILLREAGHTTDEDRYAWLSAGCRRPISSSRELTKQEATRAIDALTKQVAASAQQVPAEWPEPAEVPA